MKKYDYLIVGAGLFGAVFAHEATKRGKKCLVIDKRDHVGGNIYCEKIEGINVHKYGAHIFHTSDKAVWEYVNQFAEFNNYINSPVALYHGELYNLPFNMNTFSKMWGVTTPAEAKAKIAEQIAELNITEPKRLFVAAQKRPTRPKAAARRGSRPKIVPKRQPNVAPIAKVGTISPPLKPAAIVTAVSISFKIKSYQKALPSVASITNCIPEPLYLILPIIAVIRMIKAEPIIVLINGFIINLAAILPAFLKV